VDKRRFDRRAAYQELAAERPALFVNPDGVGYEILFDEPAQEQVADRAAAWNQEHGIPADFADIGIVYRDPFVIVVRDAVRFRGGTVGAYVRVLDAQGGAGAVVLPILSDGRIVLLRHFRHADRAWHWEVPRGFAEADADPAENARRELMEEIGCTPVDLVPLGRTFPDTGARAGAAEVFLARIDAAAFDTAVADPAVVASAVEEGIDEIVAVEPGVLHDMVRDGRITDGFTLAAYAFACARGELTA
jgi:ADP-ribose pyrophosphatase